jgi:hypothetical protein
MVTIQKLVKEYALIAHQITRIVINATPPNVMSALPTSSSPHQIPVKPPVLIIPFMPTRQLDNVKSVILNFLIVRNVSLAYANNVKKIILWTRNRTATALALMECMVTQLQDPVNNAIFNARRAIFL